MTILPSQLPLTTVWPLTHTWLLHHLEVPRHLHHLHFHSSVCFCLRHLHFPSLTSWCLRFAIVTCQKSPANHPYHHSHIFPLSNQKKGSDSHIFLVSNKTKEQRKLNTTMDSAMLSCSRINNCKVRYFEASSGCEYNRKKI